MTPLRIAIAGTGFIGGLHARAARLAGARVVGVAASSPESAERAARTLGAERAFSSAEALVEADDVDVVHICTPNHLHVPLALAALAAGKHVVCEKPISTDVEGAQQLTEAAEAAGLVAAVPFVYRYYPTVREARERLHTGVSGSVRLIHGSYLQDWLLRSSDDNWRIEEELGGASRAFADIGSHWCDLAEFVTGHRIARLCAQTLAAPGRATEDAAVVQFETDGGAVGSTVISQVSAGRKNRLWLEVDGAEESLVFCQEEPEELWVGRRERVTLIKRDPQHLSAAAQRYALQPAGHPQGYADCFDAFVAEVYAAVVGEAPAEGLPVFADGLRTARLTESVLTSVREECWVDVSFNAEERKR